MSWVAPAAGAVEALTGKKGQQHAQGQANGLTQEQLDQIRKSYPLIQEGENRAMQYDPHADTQRALASFDESANASAAADYGNAQLPLSLRGFTAGNASTDSAGFQKDVAAQRGAARGALDASLVAGEYGKKQAALSSALQPAFAGAAALSGPQQYYSNQANSWDPSGALNMIGSFDWSKLTKRKKSSSASDSWDGIHNSSYPGDTGG